MKSAFISETLMFEMFVPDADAQVIQTNKNVATYAKNLIMSYTTYQHINSATLPSLISRRGFYHILIILRDAKPRQDCTECEYSSCDQ